jgi:DNA-directed RNA polymerase delta subunit
MKRWEYKRLVLSSTYADFILENRFNELGDDGWELVSVCSMGTSTNINAIFRREKKEE